VDSAYFEDLAGRLYGLLIGLDDRIGSEQAQWLHHVIEVGEYGLALEDIAGTLAQDAIAAPVLGADADLLEAAAWLHDIGYAPDLATTGLHQLDGARYLREAQHADAMLCRLVAHHSCAIIEAGERGLADVLSSEFDPAPDVLASVLTCCDMTASPDGEPVPAGRRLAEIHGRYGSGHLVSRSIQRATPMILCAVEQVHQRAARTA